MRTDGAGMTGNRSLLSSSNLRQAFWLSHATAGVWSALQLRRIRFPGEKTNRGRAHRTHVRAERWTRVFHCTETLNKPISCPKKLAVVISEFMTESRHCKHREDLHMLNEWRCSWSASVLCETVSSERQELLEHYLLSPLLRRCITMQVSWQNKTWRHWGRAGFSPLRESFPLRYLFPACAGHPRGAGS